MDAQTALLLFVAVVAVAVLASRLRPAAQTGDRAITAAIHAALRKEFPFAVGSIDVKTFDGVVILGGVAREYQQITKAIAIANAVPGVKSVESRVSVISGG